MFSARDKPQLSLTSSKGAELQRRSQTAHSVRERQPGRTDTPRLWRLLVSITGCLSGHRPRLVPSWFRNLCSSSATAPAVAFGTGTGTHRRTSDSTRPTLHQHYKSSLDGEMMHRQTGISLQNVLEWTWSMFVDLPLVGCYDVETMSPQGNLCTQWDVNVYRYHSALCCIHTHSMKI